MATQSYDIALNRLVALSDFPATYGPARTYEDDGGKPYGVLADYDPSLDKVLKSEGGYSNDAGDPGGPTKFGITIGDYRRYVNPSANAGDVRSMPLSVAKAIYRARYWNVMHGDELPAGVDYAVFDYGVNSGVGRAARVLQRFVGAAIDGVIGPETLEKAAKYSAVKLVEEICAERLAFLQGLGTWRLFGRGWGRRVREVRSDAIQMALRTGPPMPDPQPAPAPAPAPKPVPKPVPRPSPPPAPPPKPVPPLTPWGWFAQLLAHLLRR